MAVILMLAAQTLCLLDTDTVIDLLRGDPAVQKQAKHYLQAHGRYEISGITLVELFQGFVHRKAQAQKQRFLSDYAELFNIHSHSPAEYMMAGELAGALLTAGTEIGKMDVMIAAQAIYWGWPLVTNNLRHYAAIQAIAPRLVLQSWRIAQ